MSVRILVVDDEEDIVDLISYNLEKEGFTVIKAYNGEKAIELLKTGKPKLVILDLMLPGINGLEICRLMRKNPGMESLPIIMLTAKGDEVDRILGLEMGADDYITKPFHVRELIARVRAVLRRSEERPETDKAETFTFKGLHIDYNSYEGKYSVNPLVLWSPNGVAEKKEPFLPVLPAWTTPIERFFWTLPQKCAKRRACLLIQNKYKPLPSYRRKEKFP